MRYSRVWGSEHGERKFLSERVTKNDNRGFTNLKRGEKVIKNTEEKKKEMKKKRLGKSRGGVLYVTGKPH